MKYCKKCGEQLSDEAEFCSKCGASITLRPRRSESSEPSCFGWERAGKPFGIIAVGIFLIGLAILWYLDIFWPGILFLIGFMIIAGALISYSQREKSSISSRR
jgi:ribosomal protein L40E